MVRAIMREDNPKTMTRLVVKPRPTGKQRVIEGLAHITRGMNPSDDGAVWYVGDCVTAGLEVRCPYGSPGNRLKVGESFRHRKDRDHLPPRDILSASEPIHYEADGWLFPPDWSVWGKLRPGRFLPMVRRRITLEVVSVRVERVQEITEDDAKAEGAEPLTSPAFEALASSMGASMTSLPYTSGFASLWETIHGEGSWERNDWVWVIEFRRIK